MDFVKQLKEVSISVIPIAGLALVMALILGLFGPLDVLNFAFATLLVIVGLTIFLSGINISLIPVGNNIGSNILKKNNIILLLLIGLVFGFIITIAEPDVQVLVAEIVGVKPQMNNFALLVAIALGVGIFVALALVRLFTKISLKMMLTICYVVLFIVAFMSDEFFVSIAFDSGGATTGPMSVPFIMALGIGVAGSRAGHKDSDNFGFVAMASIGPILAVLVMGLFTGGSTGMITEVHETLTMGQIVIKSMKEVGIAFAPLLVICIIMQFVLLKMPPKQVRKVILGFIYSYIGLVMFFIGVNSEFSDIARSLGFAFMEINEVLLVGIGVLFGAVVVCAEPAVWVLTEQVEEASHGHVKRTTLLVTMAIGVASAVAMAMVRIIFNLSLWYFLIPGYTLIIILFWVTPELFSGIASDSGGVATGPMTTTFLLPFAIGAATAMGGNSVETASFGLIGLIAMMPILCIEFLGLIYKAKTKKAEKAKLAAESMDAAGSVSSEK